MPRDLQRQCGDRNLHSSVLRLQRVRELNSQLELARKHHEALQQGDAASRQDAHSTTAPVAFSTFCHTVLSFPPPRPHCSPNLDDSHPAAKFRQPFCNFVLSNSHVVVSAMMLLICWQWAWMESFNPSPLRTIVSSFVMVMDPVEPSKSAVPRSSLMSSSSVNTEPPVKMAKSPIYGYRRTRLPGHLDGRDLKLAADLVQDASSQRLAIDVLRYDDKRSPCMGGGLKRR